MRLTSTTRLQLGPTRIDSPTVLPLGDRPASPAQALFDRMQMPSGQVAIDRRGTDYRLYMPMAGGRYWGVDYWFRPPDGDVHQFGASYETFPALAVQESAATFTGGGTQWQTMYAEPDAWGGGYRYTTTAGSASWTSPAGTFVGIRSVAASNAGFAKVTIDGDPTLANNIHTAAEAVALGTLASTALVANGGTLNPTDRVLDQYLDGLDYDQVNYLATGLPNTAHTVLVEYTGYKRAASSAARVYVSGWFSGPSTATGFELLPFEQINYPRSAWEYAITYRPSGGESEWLGSSHGNETIVTHVITVDGDEVDLADGELMFGDEIVCAKVTELQHPEHVAPTADVVSTVTVNDSGLRVVSDIEWLQPGNIGNGYAAMNPVVASINRYRLSEHPTVETLDADDEGFYGTSESLSMVGWQEEGHLAVGTIVSRESVNGWADANDQDAFVQDRTGFNKMYFTRAGGGLVDVVNGTAWHFNALHRAVYMDDPEATFA